MTYSAPFRFIAMVLVVALLTVAATPAKVDADPTLWIALAGVGLAILIVVVFLIVANVADSQKSKGAGRAIWYACVGEECGPIPASAVVVPAPSQLVPVERQGP